MIGAVLVGRRRLIASHEQYARRLLVVRDQERSLLAGEVHAEMSQRVTGLQMALANEEAPPTPEVVAQTAARLGTLREDLRALAHRMHPAITEKHGLDVALEHLRDELQATLNFEMDLHLSGTPMPKGDLSHSLYRIIQEALNNVRAHAGIDTAEVRVVIGEREITVEVEDTGVGFDQTTDRGRGLEGLGLLSMKDRAVLSGATLDIRSRPGTGTRVRVRVPRPQVGDAART